MWLSLSLPHDMHTHINIYVFIYILYISDICVYTCMQVSLSIYIYIQYTYIYIERERERKRSSNGAARLYKPYSFKSTVTWGGPSAQWYVKGSVRKAQNKCKPSELLAATPARSPPCKWAAPSVEKSYPLVLETYGWSCTNQVKWKTFSASGREP